MTRAPEPLPPPTFPEREAARKAAAALRLAIAYPSTMGEASTVHIDMSRPRRALWITSWANLPGFQRVNGAYQHDCLPGWQYQRREIVTELIPDLEVLAERGERPTQATNTEPTEQDNGNDVQASRP